VSLASQPEVERLSLVSPGIRAMAIGAFWFSLMGLFVKLAGRRLGSMEIVFARSVITLGLSWWALWRLGVSPLGNNRRLLFVRGLLGATALLFYFYSIVHLPLGEATLIQYTNPVFAVLLAAVILRESLRAREIACLVASLLGAAISLLKYLADPYNQLPAITFWLMGSFAAASEQEIISLLPAVVLALAVLVLLAWRINLLALPEDEARALGVNTRRLRASVIAAATLATSASVAVSGIIGWVGLVVPHMARLVVGPEFSRLLPVAALFGAMFMLVIDTIARTLAIIEVPPGILTAVIGTPVFIALLARARRAM